MFDRKCNCLIKIIISLVLGFLIGYVFYFGLISEIILALVIALFLATVGLILLVVLILSTKKETNKCICMYGKCLTIGILGTLVLSTIALSISLAIESVEFAILVGLLGTFLVLSVMSTGKLLYCLIESKCNCREE